jgi:hypothetical protein
MGWDFSALIPYGGPTPKIVKVIDHLEVAKVYLPLQPVIDYGREQDYCFARPGARQDSPVWRSSLDWARILTRRPVLPSLKAWLELPSDFMLMFGLDAIWVHHTVRWLVFLTDNRWQTVLLDAIRHIVELFGSSECIITRDAHPALMAFEKGASFSDALCAATEAQEGEVSDIQDLYIDKGFADDLAYEGPDGEYYAVQVWDSHGYWRFIP